MSRIDICLTMKFKRVCPMKHEIDYEIIPAKDMDDLNEQAWDIRILSGNYIETIIRYGNIAVNEEKDALTFNFRVISSPIEDLTLEDIDLQNVAGDVLESILENAVMNDSLAIRDADNED